MHKIFDLCCGQIPWVLRNYIWKIDGVTSIISEPYSHLPQGAEYFCLDAKKKYFTRARTLIKSISQNDPGFNKGRIEFVKADCTNLDNYVGTADTVFLADVLNTPCTEYVYRSQSPAAGIRESDKVKIVQQAVRILKPGGSLIVALYETPEYARTIVDSLRRGDFGIQVEHEHGDLNELIGERCIFEMKLVKNPEHTTPQITPISEKEREYLEQLAVSDTLEMLGGMAFG